MKNIKVVILNQNTSISYQLSADEGFVVSVFNNKYHAADIYLIEVDWKGNETTLFVPGEVVEFASASVGMELLKAIKSGERRFKAPTQSSEGENDDD